ncbi:MAG TPA: BCD family MFS transporter [Anaerolineales bacterium]|nr:BCD family MFS transporter [Anaerolineales bacterium]
MLRKRIQLGLIHTAVAVTLVPINSTLNRILIEDMAVLATVVVLLFSPPYLFSFIQVAIGSFSDRYPILGYRRTPYIAFGLLLCAAGLASAAQVALRIPVDFWAGIGLSALTFAAWGMGFNLASVSYFSLAAELSGEHGRSRTTAVMFFMMIIGIIITAAGLSRYLQVYTPERLQTAFMAISLIALAMGLAGLIALEQPSREAPVVERRYPLGEVFREVWSSRPVRQFFTYLLLLLAAVLGQDVLLEPYAARAFGMPVDETTRITQIWGTCYLVALLFAGALEGRVSKIRMVRFSSWMAVAAFVLVAASGLTGGPGVFYLGVVLLGFATGPATVANLSVMLDMTHPGRVGLFIGAWGSASAFARLLGYLVTASARDLARLFPGSALYGYTAGFTLLAVFVVVSLVVLNRIDIAGFIAGDGTGTGTLAGLSAAERAALAGDV